MTLTSFRFRGARTWIKRRLIDAHCHGYAPAWVVRFSFWALRLHSL
jgi:hypothetical protein